MALISVLFALAAQTAQQEPLIDFGWVYTYSWIDPPVFRDEAAVPLFVPSDDGLLIDLEHGPDNRYGSPFDTFDKLSAKAFQKLGRLPCSPYPGWPPR